ncbi:chitin synthase-domain-containing protein [Radiomyces spectabilis]|uniref:chitin synthase-domain-containing protein n=1 Tax=Radiomyces spectabilis TaxID=64574 RepID=UPI00221E42D8|nr:chitin synthase-domain-containing protein [Radiomyces spectabilis]KAI8381288.1 chitin synthase-domain-containing protein [Radiomyces spectabilis]
MHKPACRRIVWVAITRLCTIIIPDVLLRFLGGMTTSAARQAWREKITLFTLYLAIAGLFCFWLEYVSTFFCDPAKTYPYDTVYNHTNYAGINGWAVNWSDHAASSAMAAQVSQYAGYDLSPMFPNFMKLHRDSPHDTYNDPVLRHCIADADTAAKADRWLQYKLTHDPGYVAQNGKLVSCPMPDQRNKTGAPCYYTHDVNIETQQFGLKGKIVYKPSFVANNCSTMPARGSPGRAYVILDGNVLDVTDYLDAATNIVKVSLDTYSRAFAMDRLFLPLDLSVLLFINLGNDVTDYIQGNISGDPQLYKACLKTLFFKGIVPDNISTGCARINPALWATMGCGLIYFLIKMNLANLSRIQFIQKSLFKSDPEPSALGQHAQPHTILMVPCYAEPSDTVKRAIDTLARTNYDDGKKLLLFVCDGVVKNPQDTKESYLCILEALGYSSTEQPVPQAYLSLGQDRRKVNYAKVYAGYYETGRNRVPFMMIVKIGAVRERNSSTRPPGNRGKRDSMALVLGFLERCMNLAHHRMTPLEYELFNQCYNILGIDPRVFKYLLVTDADLQLQADVVQRLVSRLERDRLMLAVSGHVRPANPEKNFVTMLQIFPIYQTFFSGLAYEACLGSVTSINGGFVMYKLWADSPLIDSSDTVIPLQSRMPTSIGTSTKSLRSKWPKVSDEINPFDDPSSIKYASSRRRVAEDGVIVDDDDNSMDGMTISTRSESILSLTPNLDVRACCIHPTVLRGLTTPQPDTLHMKNVLLLGEEQYFGIVLLRSHPGHRLGFEPEAIGYATLPTNFFALQALMSRNLRATFHNQIEMQRVASQLGFSYWVLSITKLLDMIFSLPIIVYLYNVYIRFFIGSGLAYTIIAGSFACLVLLHFVFFIARRQFKYVLWFALYCVFSMPLFAIWFPLVAAWSSDYAERWYDVWPTQKGYGGRLHGIIDDPILEPYTDQEFEVVSDPDEQKLKTEDEMVSRLRLGEFETLEAERAYRRELEEAAALDANFTGFTGFAGSRASTMMSRRSQPAGITDPEILPSPPVSKLVDQRFPSHQVGNTSGFQSVAAVVDTYSTMRSGVPLQKISTVPSTEHPDPFSDPLSPALEDPFDDTYATSSRHPSLKEHRSRYAGGHQRSGPSQTSNPGVSNGSEGARFYTLDIDSGSPRATVINKNRSLRHARSVSLTEPAPARRRRSYSAESILLPCREPGDHRSSVYSTTSVASSCLSLNLDTIAYDEPMIYGGGPRHIIDASHTPDGSNYSAHGDMMEGRSMALHGNVGLKIPERMNANLRNYNGPTPPLPIVRHRTVQRHPSLHQSSTSHHRHRRDPSNITIDSSTTASSSAGTSKPNHRRHVGP